MKNKIEKIIKILEGEIQYYENVLENNTEPFEKVKNVLHYHLGMLDTLRNVVRLLKGSGLNK